MQRTFAVALVLCAIAPAATADPVPLGKSLDLGPLGEYFTLVAGEAVANPSGTCYHINLKLLAKKDVDPADFYYVVGVFDKDKVLLEAEPLRFDQNFPLAKGETTFATCRLVRLPYLDDELPWHKVRVRLGKKPN